MPLSASRSRKQQTHGAFTPGAGRAVARRRPPTRQPGKSCTPGRMPAGRPAGFRTLRLYRWPAAWCAVVGAVHPANAVAPAGAPAGRRDMRARSGKLGPARPRRRCPGGAGKPWRCSDHRGAAAVVEGHPTVADMVTTLMQKKMQTQERTPTNHRQSKNWNTLKLDSRDRKASKSLEERRRDPQRRPVARRHRQAASTTPWPPSWSALTALQAPLFTAAGGLPAIAMNFWSHANEESAHAGQRSREHQLQLAASRLQTPEPAGPQQREHDASLRTCRRWARQTGGERIAI